MFIKTATTSELSSINEQLAPELQILARTGGIDGILKMFAYGLSFAVNAVLARIVGPYAIGSVAVALSLLNTAQIFTCLGLEMGIMRLGSTYLGKNDKRNAGRVLVLGLSTCVFTSLISVSLYLLCLRSLAYHFILHSMGSSTALDLMVAIFPAICLLPIQNAVFTVFQNTYNVTIYNQIARNFLKLAVVVLMSFYVSKLLSLLVGAMAGILGAFAFQLFIIYGEVRLLGGFSVLKGRLPTDIRVLDILKYSAPLVLVPVVISASQELDLWSLGYFLSPSQTGVYAIVRVVAATILIPLVIFAEIFGVSIGKLLSRKESQAIGPILATSAKWIGLLSAGCFVVIMGSTRDILNVFGPSYLAGCSALRMLSIGQLSLCIFGATGSLLLMHDKRLLLIVNGILLLSLKAVLTIILIPRLGLLGAASASSLSNIIVQLVILVEIFALLEYVPGSVKVYLIRIAIIVASVLMTIAPSLMMRDVYYLVRLCICSAVGGGTFIVLAFAFEKWDALERQLFSHYYRKLFPIRT